MSYHDRDWAADDNPMNRFGRPGGDLEGMRPTLDNPVTWSLPAGRYWGIAVRIHLIFLIFIVVELLRGAVAMGTLGFQWTVMMLGGLFGIVLLHEFGHCIACRKVGGEADEILMWPLGGLAFCRPPQDWRAHFITAAGGPVVNVIICLILCPTLYVLTGTFWGVAIPKLFDLSAGLATVMHSWVLTCLFLVNWTSLILLLFNLLPVFPLDGGRILQALLWPKLGYSKSMRFAVRAGYFGAIGLGIAGFVTGNMMLLLIAVFGGITCFLTSKQLQFTNEFMGFGTETDYSASLEPDPPEEPARVSRRQEKLTRRRVERARAEAEREDRILNKISLTGMESLSGPEKRFLRRATRKRREGPENPGG